MGECAAGHSSPEGSVASSSGGGSPAADRMATLLLQTASEAIGSPRGQSDTCVC